VNRASVTVRHQVLMATNPTERAVYREATIGPEGAEILLALQLDPRSLRLPSAAYAAVLEDLARVIRAELTDQEQHAIQSGAGEPARPQTPQIPQTERHSGGAR
jgi:hypothetical protein